MSTIRNRARTIADGWQRFEAIALKRGIPPDTLPEVRMSFYSGAATVLGVMTEISKSEVSEAAGVHILEGLHQEVRAFAIELQGLAAQMRAQEQRS